MKNMKKESKMRYLAPALSVIDYMTEIGYATSGEPEMGSATVEFETGSVVTFP